MTPFRRTVRIPFFISVHAVTKLDSKIACLKMTVVTKASERGKRKLIPILSSGGFPSFIPDVGSDCVTRMTSDLTLSPLDLQQGPSVAEMMVSLGPAEIRHRLQKLSQLSEAG